MDGLQAAILLAKLPYLEAYKYLNHKATDFPISSKYQNELLSLPLFPELKKQLIHDIVEAIKNFVA